MCSMPHCAMPLYKHNECGCRVVCTHIKYYCCKYCILFYIHTYVCNSLHYKDRATSSTGEHAGRGSTTYKPDEYQGGSFTLVDRNKTAVLDPKSVSYACKQLQARF